MHTPNTSSPAPNSTNEPLSNCTSDSPDPGSLSQLTSEIKLLRDDVGDLKTNIKMLTDLLIQCNQRLELSEKRVTEAETKIQCLEKQVNEIPVLKATIQQLSEQVQSQAKSNLKNQVEILGINETTNENPVHTILTVAMKLGVDLQDTDIDFVTRTGPRFNNNSEITSSPRQENQPRPLVVKFLRHNKRNEFLRAGKTRRNISSEKLDVPGPSRTIYINERLTKEDRQLFRAARLRAKECDYKFCWIKNGTVYIRKKEGNPAITIKTMDDLLRYCPATTAQTSG
ncbi:uncharacterized protein LOC124634150 [Helicoverpa zea]|uniref:uncharacterized protein LOC124634150 n=1 Tax=Helicoverpa zea TaxID=7113 RepID=UPI001F5702C9|nr:uncharacterized protein LOC124634150 [Helicoverpa zea]